MIQLLENIYAVPVELNIGKYKVYGMELGFDFEILGTVTKDTIDFDVIPYCIADDGGLGLKDHTDNSMILFDEIQSFRSLLTSKGILFENPYPKPTCDCLTEYDREGCDEKCYKYINSRNGVVEKIVIIKKL